MFRAIIVLTVVSAVLVAPRAAAQVEPMKPEGKALPETQKEDLGLLREELKRLQEQTRRLQGRLERLQPDPDHPSLNAPPWPELRPRLEEHWQGLEEHLRGLEDQMRQWERQFPDMEGLRRRLEEWSEHMPRPEGQVPEEWFGTATQGQEVTIEHRPDGSVRVQVRERSADGQERVETYEAKSVEEFRQRHPDVARRYGFGLDGLPGLQFRFWSPRERSWHRPIVPPPFFDSGPRDRLGVWVEAPDPTTTESLDLDEGEGLRVSQVDAGSLAETLGLQPGDVILSINGQTIEGVDTVKRALRATKQRTVSVEIYRPGEGRKELQATRPEPRRLRREVI